jgi:transaldolase
MGDIFMEFFLDTAIIEEIKEAKSYGVLDGITTNPTLISKTGKKFWEVVEEICKIVDGPISVEVVSTDADGMIKEAEEIAKISPNIVIKVPMTEEGVKAIYRLSEKGIKTNTTLIFSPMQALLALKAGTNYISPFIGRLDDISSDGMKLVADIMDIITNYDYTAKVIVASVRHPMHVKEAALIGADIVTMPYKVFKLLFKHPLTDIGLERFLEDWKNVPK